MNYLAKQFATGATITVFLVAITYRLGQFIEWMSIGRIPSCEGWPICTLYMGVIAEIAVFIFFCICIWIGSYFFPDNEAH